MTLGEVQLGTKLELDIYYENSDRIGLTLVSQLEGLGKNGDALIAAPLHKGVVYSVHMNSNIDVSFIAKGEVYQYRAVVLRRVRAENLFLLHIRQVSEIKKVQRRQFYRLEVMVPIKYRVVPSLEHELAQEIVFRNAYTRDISGGGICMIADDEIQTDDLIEFDLYLEEKKPINFYGRIVRKIKNMEGDTSKFEIGVMYCKIEDKDRERIIGYLFEKQRNFRKKGLI